MTYVINYIHLVISKMYFSICRYLCDTFREREKKMKAGFCDLVASSGENVNSEQAKGLFPPLSEGFHSHQSCDPPSVKVY